MLCCNVLWFPFCLRHFSKSHICSQSLAVDLSMHCWVVEESFRRRLGGWNAAANLDHSTRRISSPWLWCWQVLCDIVPTNWRMSSCRVLVGCSVACVLEASSISSHGEFSSQTMSKSGLHPLLALSWKTNVEATALTTCRGMEEKLTVALILSSFLFQDCTWLIAWSASKEHFYASISRSWGTHWCWCPSSWPSSLSSLHFHFLFLPSLVFHDGPFGAAPNVESSSRWVLPAQHLQALWPSPEISAWDKYDDHQEISSKVINAKDQHWQLLGLWSQYLSGQASVSTLSKPCFWK